MRRWFTTALLLTFPMLAGCCCGQCGYRLFCRPCMFGGCGPVCGTAGCPTCAGGHGAFYPAVPTGPVGGPMITTPPPPAATGQPIEKLTSAQHVPTKTLR
jgi:hypothetical protein